MKTCTKCNTNKQLEEFHRDNTTRDGRKPKCKACRAKYYAKPENKARKAKTNAKWYAKPEVKAHQAKTNAKWRAKPENKARKAKAQAEWRAKPEVKARQAKTNAKYRAKPENKAITEMRNVIRRAGRGDEASLKIYGLPTKEMVVELHKGRSAIYRKHFRREPKHLDHMKPLSGADGDTAEMHRRSHFTNLVYIPASANLGKSAKEFWDWLSTQDKQMQKCVGEQDAYNKRTQLKLAC